MHRDGLARCAAVIAMIRRGPPTRDRVILRTTPCRSRIGKGERRTGIARITRRRRAEARCGRTFNRLRTPDAADYWRCGVMHRDGLTRCAAVVAMIGRCPGPRDRVILRTTPGRSRIGKGEARTGIARIGSSRRAEAWGGRTFNRLRTAYPADHWRGGVMHRDRLTRCAAVIAMIGRGPGSG